MPVALLTGGYGIVNGHLYILGGANSDGTSVNTTYDYDIAGNTWTTRTAVPSAISGLGSAVVGNNIIIFGGGTPFFGDSKAANARSGVQTGPMVPDAVNTTRIFDTTTFTWSTGPNLNVARSFTTGTRAGNYLVSIEGFDGTEDLNTTEVSVTRRMRHADANTNSYCYGDIHTYSDSYGYSYFNPHGDGDSDSHRYSNSNCHTNSDRSSYGYADCNGNGYTCGSDGLERNHCDSHQLHRKLEQCNRREWLPIGCVHEFFFCRLRARVPRFGRRQHDESKRYRADEKHELLLPVAGV